MYLIIIVSRVPLCAFCVLSVIFSIYVQNFNNYSAEFGALSAAVVIMLWLYYSAFIVAFGAIFNSEAIESAKPYATRVY